MPHIIVEHSADISHISKLQKELPNILASITEGNFDADQCKCRAFAFDEYLVGKTDQKAASFLHITVKILAGRSPEVRKKAGQQIMEYAKKFFAELKFSPDQKAQIIEAGKNLADAITGIPHVPPMLENTDLVGKRCDISVDIVEMEKETYQKFRVE